VGHLKAMLHQETTKGFGKFSGDKDSSHGFR
jgi:hypothetical protein